MTALYRGKMRTTKKYMLWLTGGIMSLLLAACGSTGGGKDAGTSGNGAKSAEENVNKGPVKLVFYSTAGWTQEAFNERFGDAMRKKFPNYTIEYIQSGQGAGLADLMAAGQQIDVFWQAVDVTIQQMQEYKLEYDMSDLIKKHGLDLNTLEPSSINAVRSLSGGKMYALPLVINTAALYYNKDLFDKFGVPYPKDNMTWDQVIDVAKRMYRTDGGQPYFGLGTSITHNFSLNPQSVPYVDRKTEKATILTDPKWKSIFEVIVEAYKTTGGTALGPTQFVQNKNIAMTEGLANLFLNLDMTAMNWDMVRYPTYKEAPGKAPQPYPTLFGVTSTSKFKDEAFQVLQHMLSEQEQLSLSERAVIPVLQKDNVQKAFGTKSKYQGKNFQSILSRKFSPMPDKTKYDSKAQPIYNKYVPNIAKGEMDLNTAFRSIDEDMSKMIAEEKAK
ncbi:ABC transporter substrate-binding protein [Paenibacillus ginsengarvi]|uniref:ABC transporter substrate-binding protein n=1 Tax=Paenibacillus ginsengarvi TaxID=400777 RepID=UPI0013155937|nr:extracellular solute-binding protein [Paenibacillus ginsengarvi]